MADLRVKISADVADVTKGMTAVEVQAERLKAEILKLNAVIGTTTDHKKLESALDSLRVKQNEYNRIVGFTKDKQGQLASVTNQATTTMTNFTRVIQDAPFGIRGIANNIDPLVESFTRLQQKTGSTSAAFRSMVATLAGRAGLLLAVSSITSVLVSFGDEIFNSGNKTDGATDSNNKYAESINNIVKQLESERDAINQVLNGQSILTQIRELGVKLTFGEGTETDILLLKSRISQTVKALGDIRAERQKIRDQEAELETKFNKKERGFSEFMGVRTGIGDLLYTEEQYNADRAKLQSQRFKLDIDEINATDKLRLQQLQLKDLQNKNLTEKEKQRLEAYKKYVADTIAEAKRISDATDQAITLKLNITGLDNEEEQLEKSKIFLDKFKKGLFKYLQVADLPPFEYPFKVKAPTEAEIKKAAQDYANNKVLSVLYGEVGDRLKNYQADPKTFDIFGTANKNITVNVSDLLKTVSGVERLNKYIDQIEELKQKYKELGLEFKNIELSGTVLGLENAIKAAGDAAEDAAKKNKDATDQLREQEEEIRRLANVFGSILNPAFDSFFKAFDENKNVGQAFIEGLRNGIKSLVQEMIKLAAISAVISIFTGGRISFGAAFGQLSGLGNRLPARANGGPVSGGNSYMVGERGPELFVPAVSGSIVPNNSVGSFMGGGIGNIGGRGSVLRGQDILLAYARTQRSQLRVNG